MIKKKEGKVLWVGVCEGREQKRRDRNNSLEIKGREVKSSRKESV